jgi:hypothetical protein
MRALAQAGLFGAQVTGIVDATALETTAAYDGCGQVTRPRKITDQYGHGRLHNRRDFAATPIHAVVVHQWQRRDIGAGGTTVFLPTAAVQRPLPPCEDDEDRRLLISRHKDL